MAYDVPANRHFSMLRNYRLSDVITLGNASCGVGAILLAQAAMLDGASFWVWPAMALLPLALLFDALDGRVARALGGGSPMGRELDSLADVISFGVAPAALAYALGLRGIFDVGVLLFFVACGLSRLARFNITADALSAGNRLGKVAYFEGTPITSSLLVVAVLAVATALGRVGDALPLGSVGSGLWSFHPLVLLFAINGAAMVSRTLRIPKP